MDVPSGLRIKGTGGSPFEQIMMGMAQVGKGYLEEKPEADKRKLEKQKLEQEQEWKKKEFNLKKTTAAFDTYKTIRNAGGSHEEGLVGYDSVMQESDFPGSSLARTKLNWASKEDLADKQKKAQTQEARAIIRNGMYYDPKTGEYVEIPDKEHLVAILAANLTAADWDALWPEINSYRLQAAPPGEKNRISEPKRYNPTAPATPTAVTSNKEALTRKRWGLQ